MHKQIIPFSLAILVSTVFIAFGLFIISHTYSDVSNSLRITGRVIGHQKKRINMSGGHFRTVTVPIVEFVPPDRNTQRFTGSWKIWSPSYQIGDPVTVFYPTKAPQRTAVYSIFDLYLFPFFMTASGCLIFCYFFIIPPIQRRQRLMRTKRLRCNGKLITATVQGSKKGQKFGNIRYFSLEAITRDPITKQKRWFKSDPIPFNPSHVIKKGTAIGVYINPLNPKDYWVDTSSLPESLDT